MKSQTWMKMLVLGGMVSAAACAKNRDTDETVVAPKDTTSMAPDTTKAGGYNPGQTGQTPPADPTVRRDTTALPPLGRDTSTTTMPPIRTDSSTAQPK